MPASASAFRAGPSRASPAAQASAAKAPRREIGSSSSPVFSLSPSRTGTISISGEVFKAIYSSLRPETAKQVKAVAR